MATSSYIQPLSLHVTNSHQLATETTTDLVLQREERSRCEGKATVTLHLWRFPDGSHTVLFKWRQRMRGTRAKDNRFINVFFTFDPTSYLQRHKPLRILQNI